MTGLNNSDTKLLNQSSSLLTGNVKLTVNNTGFWLNAIPNSSALNNYLYKNVRVDNYGVLTYFYHVNQFFNREQLSTEAIWYNDDDANCNCTSFSAGCSLNTNGTYTEKFSYLAPLYINKTIPECFIIFKTPNQFTEQYKADFSAFVEEELRKSIIVYKYNLKDSNIQYNLYNYLNLSFNSPLKRSDYIYEYGDALNSLILYGSNIKKPSNNFKTYSNGEGNYVRYEITTDEPDITLSNEANILEYFKKYGLISTSVINIEFLFDDVLNPDNEDPSYYYGFYCDLEYLTECKIDIDAFNRILPEKINNDTLDLETGNSNFILSNTDYNTLLISNWDDTFVDNPNSLYFVEDKIKNLYNIRSVVDENILLNNDEVDLVNFFGIDKDAQQLYGKLLETPLEANLKLTLNQEFSKGLLNVGDYFSISTGFPNTKEWRIIASRNNCCGSKSCLHQPETYVFSSNDLEWFETEYNEYHDHYHTYDDYHYHIYDYHGYYHETDPIDTDFNSFPVTFKLVVTLDKYYPLEEGHLINLSWHNFVETKTTTLPIYQVKINSSGHTVFTVVDQTGELFWYDYLIDEITFTYTSDKYYFNYFNIDGSTKQLAENIATAFNSFGNKLVEAIPYNNEVLFKALSTGDAFKQFYFNYRFMLNNTDLSNFKINDITLEGYQVTDYDNNILFRSRKNSIPFFGDVASSNKCAFYIDNTLTSGLETDIAVLTKLGLSRLKESYVEDHLIKHSNFFKDLAYLNSYYTYTLDNEKDDIIVNANGFVTVLRIFQPNVYELKTLYEIDKFEDSVFDFNSLEECYGNQFISQTVTLSALQISEGFINLNKPYSVFCFEYTKIKKQGDTSYWEYGSDKDFYRDLNNGMVTHYPFLIFNITASKLATLSENDVIEIRYYRDEWWCTAHPAP